MLKKFVVSLFAVLVLFTSVSFADVSKNDSALKLKFSGLLGLKISQINATPLTGVVEIVTDQGLFYASDDGNFLIHGQLFGLGKGVVNLTEASLSKVRLEGMEKFADNMIIFPAKNEKYVITVFTDITCGYCRKLHSQIDKYNDEGITIRYLAYPRSGIKDGLGQPTKTYRDMRSVWCSDDPKKAISDAFLGKTVPYRLCKKPVAQEFEFGRQVGVNGTPAIMLSNGMMIPGYRDATSMLQVLEKIK